MKDWIIDATVIVTAAVGIFFALSMAFTSPARSAEPVYAFVQSACLTLDSALAVIEGKDADEKNEMFATGGCIFSPVGVSITIVAILGEVVWAGDGLDDLMYLVEIEDGSGFRFFSWLITADWPTLKAQLAGNKI